MTTDTPAGPTLRLQVANEVAALEPVRLAVLDFIAGQGLGERLVYQLELVLEEVLMNRVLHAFPDGGRHLTELTLQLQPDALVLAFEDDGIPFDPLDRPPPAAPASVLAAEPGGRGLMLIRKAASACRYERVGQRNRFTVYLARA
jgi:anti-sigma regulatory factor (Ser/Thr protein kinase)